MNIKYKEFLKKVSDKLSWVVEDVDFLHPYMTRDGKYANAKNHPFAWTAGFYGGILWYMYLKTKETKYFELAKECARRFDEGLLEFTELSHDVGFQFLPTSVADYFITGDERSKIRAIHAATILAGRFNYAGKFIRAWNDGEGVGVDSSRYGYAIIDCMMNTPLLYWASETTGDPRYCQIANLHAQTVMENFVREDGSVNHIVVFDPVSGDVVDKPAGQGYSEGSSWTRGQAWAIYGFAMSYHYTGNESYLNTAKKVAEYFMDNTSDEYMPIDFKQPGNPKYMDCSAAAICVCGLLEVMKYISEEEKIKYTFAVDRLMKILLQNCDFTNNTQSILQNCSEMYHRESSRHVSLIYGDFYLLEALMRLNGNDVLFYKKKSE